MWIPTMRKTVIFGAMLLFGATLSGINGTDSLRAENLTITLQAGNYQIVNQDEGRQVIRMDDFGSLLIPGKPMLPAKTFMICVPPGARVQSVVTDGGSPIQIEGRYNIAPAPPVLPSDDRDQMVKECRARWQSNYQATYSSDQGYPAEPGKYVGTGGLRKYTFVSVVYAPFSYYPKSGKLTLRPSLTVSIDYSLSPSNSLEYEKSLMDTKGDERASRLLVNYSQARPWYLPRQTGESPKQTYDYVIITTDALIDAVTPLVSWKDSLGYTVNVVTTSWINMMYSGSDLQQKIRNFLIDKYLVWGIEYVLLVGSVDVLPMRRCYPNPSDHSSSSEYAPPTDYYYADLTGSWDADHDGYYGEYGQDSLDFVPEVSVGRIPFSDTTTVKSICQKLVSFEKDTTTWRNNALLLGAMSNYYNEDSSELPRTDGAQLMEVMVSRMLSGWSYTKMYEKEGLDPCTYACDFPLTRSNVVSNWSANDYGVVNWWAHGGSDAAWRKYWAGDDGDGIPESGEMAWEAFLQNSDAASLDDGHPSIIFSCSCDNGWPEQNNLAKMLLKHGSAGIVAATRISWYNEAWQDESSGSNASLDYYFFYYLIHENQKAGDALSSDRVYYLNHLFWSLNDPDWTPQANLLDFNLYGDPALPRTATPQFTRGDCNHDGTVDAGDVVYLVNYLFKGGPPPNPLTSGDCTCDGVVNAGDVVYVVNYLFKGGPAPTC
ncbi:MAG: C25 family cysteine peptidase [Candidatus Zixiibacteriota bacterium]